ncbi:MAG: hypothetical protein IKW68_00085 [Clostridia bacterium]|nr:hypothetical protein [Clostridia bacterium]
MKVTDFKDSVTPAGEFPEDIKWIDVREAPFSIHGVFYDESIKKFARLPRDVASATSSNVNYLSLFTAGGRIRFRTDSRYVGIYAVMTDGESKTTCQMDHGFDLSHYDEHFGRETYAYSFVPPSKLKGGFSAGFYTDGKMKDYVLHLPTNGEVHELYVGLKADADVLSATPYKHQKPVVYYGSSITQGACASRPANIYEAIVSRRLDTDFIDLGFGGSCLGESAIVNYMATLDASVFVCDYDHNAPNAEYLERTHPVIYRTLRAANPTLPIVFISAPNIMPDYTWHIPRREVIRRTYEAAIAAGDDNVYFIDGETFFDIPDRDMCTVDSCHPNDLGMYLIANKVTEVLDGILNGENA